MHLRMAEVVQLFHLILMPLLCLCQSLFPTLFHLSSHAQQTLAHHRSSKVLQFLLWLTEGEMLVLALDGTAGSSLSEMSSSWSSCSRSPLLRDWELAGRPGLPRTFGVTLAFSQRLLPKSFWKAHVLGHCCSWCGGLLCVCTLWPKSSICSPPGQGKEKLLCQDSSLSSAPGSTS